MTKTYTYGALFAGIGGMSRGFLNAGFAQAFSVDFDAGAAEAHKTICGEACTVADLSTMLPQELRALSPRRPDVLITSPPCKAFSGCLPRATSLTDKYLDYSSLTERGIMLALEAWPDDPPALIVFENVPTITTRGRAWLDAVIKMLDAYGYAVRESAHDCGEIGALAQRRRRFLLVARHRATVPGLLYQPHKQPHKGVGEVIGALPVPVPGGHEGGPLHRLPQLSALNAVRLALVPAGGDWRDLPAQVEVVCAPRRGVYGVGGWDEPSGCVVGAAKHDNGRFSIADPRIIAPRREGSVGVVAWDGQTHAVIGRAFVQNTALQIADPRVHYQERAGAYHVTGWAEATHCVIGASRPDKGQAVADPRVPQIVGDTLIDLNARRCDAIIVAADGTWHRPLTTLELAALQGFDVGDAERGWLVLPGKNNGRWREWIGNAVPPPSAREIARQCLLTLHAAGVGGFRPITSQDKPWVSPHQEASC
jgi:site-specific DNA-cytosine methylase